MDLFLPPVALRLFRRETGIVMPALVHAFERAIGKKAADERWDRIDYAADLDLWHAHLIEHLAVFH
jgi:hypothetical protein